MRLTGGHSTQRSSVPLAAIARLAFTSDGLYSPFVVETGVGVS